MGEKLILGLQIGKEISPARDRKDLHFVLTKTDQRRLVDIDKIRLELIRAIGAEISIYSLFDTGLAELNWQQIYHQNALSSVYLGTKEKQAAFVKFSDSEAIIAIHSRVNNQQIEVKDVEMSYIIPDSQKRKRVLSIFYDAHSFKAYRGLVSIADDEKSEYPKYYHSDYPREEEARLVKIPSVIDGPFFLSSNPLVSLRMSQLAQGDTRMIEARTTPNDQWYILFIDFFKDRDKNNRIIIGRGNEANDCSWRISFPASLAPVESVKSK